MTALRALTTLLLLLVATALCACADDTSGDTAGADTTDPGPDATPAAPVEYALEFTVTNGLSEDGVPGIESCTESPVGTELFCKTTDDNGVITHTLTDPVVGPLLTRLSGDDYLNTLVHGRLGEDVLASWDEQMAGGGKVELGSIIVGEFLLTAAVAPLGTEIEEGTGAVFVVLNTLDQSSVEGATLTVQDGSGAEAGASGYADDTGLAVDPALEATGPTGGFGAFNLPPGEYSVEVSLPGSSCTAGIAWPATSGQTFPFLVEGNSVSTVLISCTQD